MNSTGSPAFHFENVTGFIKKSKSKNGHVMSTSFVIPFRCNFCFKLTKESDTDRFFKKIGIAQEIQSGDQTFDQKIYIACDSRVFAHKITTAPEVRSLILELFNAGCSNIRCNGNLLIMDFNGDRTLETSLGERLIQVYRQIFDMNTLVRRFPADAFALKTILIEGAIWSIAAYGFTAFFSSAVSREDLHIYPGAVATHGMVFGLILTALLIGAVVLFMKGSSRGHRIIVESAIVLVLALPAAGISMVADQNVSFDKKTPVLISRKLHDKQRVAHRSRRGTSYSYHLYLAPPEGAEQISVPRDISVAQEIFNQAQVGDTVQIEIGQGWLNHPWYKNFQFNR
ncbi:hypothetical protein [Bdellovibrio sp. HCB337]|uniref:hypothetical protein n=1 Tax=Bdellovibrio sp. HCB337 TaxID=3394358 RepID=UPI0039A69C49